MINKEFNTLSILLTMALSMCITGVCTGCTQASVMNDRTYTYESNYLGFSLVFPSEWEGKYIVDESENRIDVFNKKVYGKYECAGLLFSIERIVGELITEEDLNQEPVSRRIILQGNGYTVILRMPSDIQFPLDEEELRNDYESMKARIHEISNSIYFFDNRTPKAVNDGFKVVGSSFFTVEIPENLEIMPLEEHSTSWVINNENLIIGMIEQIPYSERKLLDEKTIDDTMIQEKLYNDETSRAFQIVLDPNLVTQDQRSRIITSFKFISGPFTVVDLQSNVEQYLESGGRKAFGTIKDIEIKNGKPIAVYINLMNILTDNQGNEYVEDLELTEIYELDFEVTVAPLIAPGYDTYGIYDMMPVDENFIENYKVYKDVYYDLIIGSDGQLKIILGHILQQY